MTTIVDRIDRYCFDCDALLGQSISTPTSTSSTATTATTATLSSTAKCKSVTSQCNKLRDFMRKHQMESIPPSIQSRLLMTIEKYYLWVTSVAQDVNTTSPVDQTFAYESVLALVSDLLCLPEGKLVSGKAKKRVLSWQTQLLGQHSSKLSPSSIAAVENKKDEVWTVAEVNEATQLVTLLSSNREEVLDDVKAVDETIFRDIATRFAFLSASVICETEGVEGEAEAVAEAEVLVGFDVKSRRIVRVIQRHKLPV